MQSFHGLLITSTLLLFASSSPAIADIKQNQILVSDGMDINLENGEGLSIQSGSDSHDFANNERCEIKSQGKIKILGFPKNSGQALIRYIEVDEKHWLPDDPFMRGPFANIPCPIGAEARVENDVLRELAARQPELLNQIAKQNADKNLADSIEGWDNGGGQTFYMPTTTTLAVENTNPILNISLIHFMREDTCRLEAGDLIRIVGNDKASGRTLVIFDGQGDKIDTYPIPTGMYFFNTFHHWMDYRHDVSRSGESCPAGVYGFLLTTDVQNFLANQKSITDALSRAKENAREDQNIENGEPTSPN